MCSWPEYKGISMRTGLSTKGKIDRESDKGNSTHKGSQECGGGSVRMGLLRPREMEL